MAVFDQKEWSVSVVLCTFDRNICRQIVIIVITIEQPCKQKQSNNYNEIETTTRFSQIAFVPVFRLLLQMNYK